MSLLQQLKTEKHGEGAQNMDPMGGNVNFTGMIVCTSFIDFSKLS